MNKSVNIRIADVHWVNSDNLSRCASGLFRNTDDENKLALSLSSGYRPSVGGTIGVREATAEEVKTAIEARAEQLKAIKAIGKDAKPREVRVEDNAVSISSADLERIFNRLYVDAKGKIIAPKYIGVTGYRRGASMLLANTIAAKQGLEGCPEVLAEVMTFTSKKDQFIANLQENTQKTDGAWDPGLKDRVGAAKKLYQLGASEADIGRAFGLNRAGRQKYTAICKLDSTYPDLKVVDRIVSGELENAKSYTYVKVNALMKDGKSSEEVEQFLLEPTDNKAKIMARPDIERLCEQCPVELIKVAMTAILQNDAGILENYVLKAEAVNAAVEKAVA